MIRLVASDMDGTLLNSQKETGRGLKGVIRTLRNRGVLFAAASGRSRGSILSYFDDMPVTVIANNGGAVYLEDGTLLFTGEFPYEKARPVMEAARSASYMHLVLIGVKTPMSDWMSQRNIKIFADFISIRRSGSSPAWSRYF